MRVSSLRGTSKGKISLSSRQRASSRLRESRWFLHCDYAMMHCDGFRCGLLAGGLEPDDQLGRNPHLVLDLDAHGPWPEVRAPDRLGLPGRDEALLALAGGEVPLPPALRGPGAAT
jgi:hypothetical protein